MVALSSRQKMVGKMMRRVFFSSPRTCSSRRLRPNDSLVIESMTISLAVTTHLHK